MKREEIESYLQLLRDEICRQFQEVEEQAKFHRTEWKYKDEGGGQMSVLRGEVFEKAAVNWSGVAGQQFPMKDGMGPFYATGVSLITHMKNPHVPTVHMNIRYIETKDRWWLGGGYDLTPMGFVYPEDTEYFHRVAKDALSSWGLYEEFSKAAKEYFFLPHYQQERGVGGIFFDHFHTGDKEQDFAMWKSVGKSLTKAYMPIVKKRMNTPYTEEDRQKQIRARGRYVEFNLLYDRGTKFGFSSGGNPEAILCSMPPLVSW